jgi:hypothetical protein
MSTGTKTSTRSANGSTASAMALRPTAFEVQSQTNPAVTYRVQLPDCDCKDFRYRRANPPAVVTRIEDLFCKHLVQGFRVAGWQLPAEPLIGLSEDEAFELLIRLHVGRHAADDVLAAARTFRSSRAAVGESVLVLSFDRVQQLFTVQL